MSLAVLALVPLLLPLLPANPTAQAAQAAHSASAAKEKVGPAVKLSADRLEFGTVKAIENELMCGGLVWRYRTNAGVDGLPAGEGAFLACSFWLADNYVLQGRIDEAERLFERLVALANDVGLLAEQYDPAGRLLLGNFPQAFSHVMLVNTAHNLAGARHPAEDRRQ